MEDGKDKVRLWVTTLLRIAIGWHFLYEGFYKLITPGWTSAAYLSRANWLMGDLFRAIPKNQVVLEVVDLFNIWGLIVIGFSLMSGLMVRYASAAGFFLLLLYYMASPSLIGTWSPGEAAEGNYLLVNKNIIEALALFFLMVSRWSTEIGLDSLVRRARKSLNPVKPGSTSLEKLSLRRSVLRNLAVLPFFGAFLYAWSAKKNILQADAFTGATTPVVRDKSVKELASIDYFNGNIGDIKITRLILGNSTFGAWPHSRDLKYVGDLSRSYNTHHRIINTFRLASELGINTVQLYPSQFEFIRKYRIQFGDELQVLAAVAVNSDDWKGEIDLAVKMRACCIYIQPYAADRLIHAGDPATIKKAVAYIKDKGIPAGIGCFSVKTVETAIEQMIDVDFFVKAIHGDGYWSAIPLENRVEFEPAYRRFYPDHNKFHDNIFDLFPEKTVEVMKSFNKPWIGFKTMASGAISPADAFDYAFRNGADFISAGMYDFQMENNIRTVHSVLSEHQKMHV